MKASVEANMTKMLIKQGLRPRQVWCPEEKRGQDGADVAARTDDSRHRA